MDKIDSDWRIARRSMIYDWHQDVGNAVDWSSGLMGMPLDAATHCGRAHRDPSERFLDDGWSGAQDGAVT